MILKQIEIRNFRSIAHLIIHPKNITSFIGKNSCGKSNVLRALQFFFTFGRTAIPDDLCKFADDGGTWVECVFAELTEPEKDALDKYVRADGSIRVRRTLKIAEDKCWAEFNGYIQRPSAEWLQDEYADYADMDKWRALGIDVAAYAKLGSKGKLTKDGFKEFQKNYVKAKAPTLEFSEELSPTEFKGRQSTAAAILPHFIFVPAVGDIVSVIYGKQSSLLNEIVTAVIDGARDYAEYDHAQESLRKAQEFVNPSERRLPKLTQIEADLANRLKSWPGTTVTIRTQVSDLAKILVDGLTLDIDDGHDTPLAEKGDGIQRQILFRVFQLYADFRGKRGVFSPAEGEPALNRGPSIIAFEEPELFLHPQAQEQFYDDLLTVSQTDQVLLATHSSYLIHLDQADGLHIVRRNTPTAPSCLTTADANWLGADDRSRLKEMNLCSGEASKILFADRVIVTEGQEDLIYINGTATEHEKCLDRRITVVEARGKSSIPILQRVLNAFRIPYVVACDEDPGNAASIGDTNRIEALIEDGNRTQPDLARLELFTPNLPTECQGAAPAAGDKVMTAFKFIREHQPAPAFCGRIRQMFTL